MRDRIGRHRPVLPLEGHDRRAEVVLLTQQFPVGLPAITGERHLEFLRAGDLRFLDFQDDPADRLRGVKRQDQRLLAGPSGHPTAPPRASSLIEGVIHGMLGGFGADQHGRRGSDVDRARRGDRGGRKSLDDLLAEHGSSLRLDAKASSYLANRRPSTVSHPWLSGCRFRNDRAGRSRWRWIPHLPQYGYLEPVQGFLPTRRPSPETRPTRRSMGMVSAQLGDGSPCQLPPFDQAGRSILAWCSRWPWCFARGSDPP